MSVLGHTKDMLNLPVAVATGSSSFLKNVHS